MRCRKSNSVHPNYDVEIKKDNLVFIHISKPNSNQYNFGGILTPEADYFYLLFDKEDEELLPIAISFQIENENEILCNQYQMLSLCLDMNPIHQNNIYIQFHFDKLSHIYSCKISPCFPFPVEIFGTIRLKNLNNY
jgi:hypothetical protein